MDKKGYRCLLASTTLASTTLASTTLASTTLSNRDVVFGGDIALR